ncbi:hypothetical protein M406DRAFT_326083 [Cryphonectria parasitica EP155]|uniref:Uncharacterized protein n=1 Tax=Cryphonectria parasitica (strain ATCC 38755 / EP155) TaxID=660469 RepID=A0A9P5CTS7_CRYP1|nr:uncharacterized protein M406DRAFT_326083 [Cryphonectria parasitica EP155]KAF3770658.1 hypothetical protein M406DRAFT_326083 [Cryphonectria parasitica EP155]
MFDVDWSDPNRESVGDRRARKQKEKGKGKGKEKDGHKDAATASSLNEDDDSEQYQKLDDHLSQGGGTRTSGSVRTSVSSVDKQFGFFGGKHRHKGGSSSSRKGNAKSVASSSLRSPTIDEKLGDERVSVSSSSRRPDTGGGGVEDSPGLPSKRFSTWLKGDQVSQTLSSPGRTSLYQELTDGCSMITKTTVTTIRDRTQEHSDFLVSQVYISAGDDDHRPPSRPSSSKSPASQTPTNFSEVVHLPPAVETSLQKNIDESHTLPVIAEGSSDAKSVEAGPSCAKQQPHHQKRVHTRPKLSAPAISPATMRPTEKPDTWKAPNDWAISSTESALSGPPEESFDPAASDQHASATLDIAHVQRETERMLRASPRVVLMHLNGQRGVTSNIPVTTIQSAAYADDHHQRTDAQRANDVALVYKEREMERKRWLLTALYNMETIWVPEDQLSGPAVRPSVQKVLALFESSATASYLAGINISTPVYHLSPEPLSHKHYPNIHPIICPTISVSMLALATESFSSVSCLLMTSILPSAEIPKLLQGIHRILASGGYLHMVIIDPWPVARSMGPLLQSWIDGNLVFNLELQFRVGHPSRNFPVWLEEARLRGKGSIITNARFLAVSQGGHHQSGGSGGSGGGGGGGGGGSSSTGSDTPSITRELRTTVGRLLWQEIWGSFVTGDNWWWEIPEIVDECVEHKTYWEYSIIAACKASED